VLQKLLLLEKLLLCFLPRKFAGKKALLHGACFELLLYSVCGLCFAWMLQQLLDTVVNMVVNTVFTTAAGTLVKHVSRVHRQILELFSLEKVDCRELAAVIRKARHTKKNLPEDIEQATAVVSAIAAALYSMKCRQREKQSVKSL
jgi:hypothetical protein